MTPGWMADLLAALMLAVAAASAGRLLVFRLVVSEPRVSESRVSEPRVSEPRVSQLRVSRPGGTGPASTEVGHLLMGVAMAGSLASSLAIAPGKAWAVVFALLTGWLAWRAWRGWLAWRGARVRGARAVASGQCAPHLAHAVAMTYMLGIAATGARGGGMGAAQHPTISFVLAVICVGYCVWDLDQLSRRRRRPPAGDPGAAKGTRALLLSPAMTVACRVAMGVTMSFMLLTLL